MVRSHIRTCAAAVVAIGLVAGSTEASAQTAAPSVVTAESAAALAESIDAGLRQWFPATGATTDYQWDGTAKATAVGDHYDVDLPSLRIAGHDGSRFVVGVVKLALTPEAGGLLGVGITLPSPMSLLAADGSPDGDFTIGTQHFSGLWLPALGTFVKIDGRYGDLRAASPKDSSRLAIGEVTIHTDLAEAPAGRWTGPSALGVSKLDLIDEHGVQIVHLGGFALSATVTGMDLKAAVALGREGKGLDDLKQAIALGDQLTGNAETADGKVAKEEEAKTGKEGQDEAQSAEEAKDTVRRLTLIQDLLTGIAAKLELSDLAVTASAESGTVTLGHVGIQGGIQRDQGQSTVTVGYDHDGLKLAFATVPQNLLPQKVEFLIDLANLPTGKLMSVLQKLEVAKAAGNEKSVEDANRELAESFYQPGIRLSVKSLHVETPAAAVKLEGEARLDSAAARGAVAGFDMVLRGLDALTKQLQPTPGAKPDEETQNVLAVLAMLQVMGAPGKDQSGNDTRTYKLQMTSEGKVLLNGADLTAMVQLGQPQDATPTAPGAAPKPAAP